MKKRLLILLILTAIAGTGITFSASVSVRNNTVAAKLNTPEDTASLEHWIRIDPINLEILSPSSGIQFFRDGLIFSASSKSEDKMIRNQLSFGKIDARFTVLTDTAFKNQAVFSPEQLFSFPCDAVTFSADFSVMFYTRYDKDKKAEKIFRAKYSEGHGWDYEDNPLPFCSGDEAKYTQPALSNDGKFIVFSSNRSGTLGGMDLFVSTKKGETWSDPVNLGDGINSTFNELYPYLDSENNLYFSSDNILGFGGYDIYVCKFKENTWEKPINLESPINSKFDDIAFKLDKSKGKTAYYTVRQSSGNHTQQLNRVSFSQSNPDTLLTLSQLFTRPDITHMVILALEPAVQATDVGTKTAKGAITDKDTITFRVEIITSFNPKTRPLVNYKGQDYKVFEYLYDGAYRLCIGEFKTLTQAKTFQKELKSHDYPQAAVVVFRNNVLYLDQDQLAEQENIPENNVVSKPPEKVAENIPVKNENVIVDNKVNKTKEEIPENKVKTTVIPKVTIDSVRSKPAEQKESPVYRVQIATNQTPKGSTSIVISGKTFTSFEYQYAGAYRTCIGEFSSLSQAADLQKFCRQAGYPQAFVVAFIKNKRVTDPAYFK
jgi:hypothetical protein